MIKQLRHIPLDGVFNLRDLGGYPTTDKCVTKWGKLYRSDSIANLTEEGWQEMHERELKTVIDLRGESEVNASPVKVPEGIEYHHFSLMKDLDAMPVTDFRKLGDMPGEAGQKILESMKLDYGNTLFGNLDGMVEILECIFSRMDEGSVLFMCSAGKDRTGIVAGVLLYLCDTIKEDIIADYMVSATYNTNGINRMFDSLPKDLLDRLPDPNHMKTLIGSEPEMMKALLQMIEEKDLRKCLEEHGFDREKQLALKHKMVEGMELSIEDIADSALKLGFSNVALIDTKDLIFEPKFRIFCEENDCGNYGKNHGCPPDCGSTEAMQEKAMAYSHAMVFQSKTIVGDAMDSTVTKALKKKHTTMTLQVIKQMKPEGTPGLAIMAGPCNLCDTCKKRINEPCIYPEMQFSCLSAYCIDAMKLAETCGMDMEWRNDQVTLLSLYLYN